MTSANKKKPVNDHEVEDEQVEEASGQRGEASKDMKNMSEAEPIEDLSTASKKNPTGTVNSNQILESLKWFKEDVVRSKVKTALRKRDLDKAIVSEEAVTIITKELEITAPQATQYLKKFNGDLKKALDHYINSPPCTTNELIAI